MKTTIRIPTEQYAFVEIEVEAENPEEVKQKYDEIKSAFNEVPDLPQKEWNRVLDRYLNEATMESEEYYSLSPRQQYLIQELKKSFKRVTK